MKRNPRRKALNGYTFKSISIDDEGEVEVELELPVSQGSPNYVTSMTASRSFDLYEDEELQRLCQQLFRALQQRLEKPDRQRQAIHCDRCATSQCCREYNVLLSDEDIDRLRGDLPRAQFLRRYTDPAVDWTGDYRYQLKSEEDDEGEKCIFLQPDALGRMRCSVYERRPSLCREYDMAVCTLFEAIEEPPRIARAGSRRAGRGRENGRGS